MPMAAITPMATTPPAIHRGALAIAANAVPKVPRATLAVAITVGAAAAKVSKVRRPPAAAARAPPTARAASAVPRIGRATPRELTADRAAESASTIILMPATAGPKARSIVPTMVLPRRVKDAYRDSDALVAPSLAALVNQSRASSRSVVVFDSGWG